MSIDFVSPSMRAAGSDLTIAISPLGLVELADEEFEVHGPRLNRYAQAWAFYLGHHWAYRREAGEPQVTFNYVRALSDWLTNFTFSKGVIFQSPKEFQHIIPALLQRIWAKDNNKQQILWEMGNQGSVQGDAFVKVAYEPPFTDDRGMVHRGKVRILPLNASFCLTPDTEILTRQGWKNYEDLKVGEEVLSIDPETDESVWSPVEAVNVFDWEGSLARWENERFSVLSTPDHRWLYQDGRNKVSVKRTRELHSSRHNGGRLIVAGGTPLSFAKTPVHSDSVVEAVAWFVTEGHWHKNGTPMLTQDALINPEYAERIDSISKEFGGSRYSHPGKADQWYIPGLKTTIHDIAGDDKRLPSAFLCSLTFKQAKLLFDTLIDADGCRSGITSWSQSHEGRVDDFQMLAMMLGYRTQARWRQRKIGKPCCDVTVYSNRTVNVTNLERDEVDYKGKVWCPTTSTGTWVARRNGITFITGNCFPEWHPHDRDRMIRFKLKYRFWGTAPEGTRQVYTYVEIITDDTIEEYVNDELIDRRPNPLGIIPVVHIANRIASASPWGLSDVMDIIPLNREFNEKATDIADIINYYCAPITVVTGARASNLERGAKQIWAIPQKDVRVENLTGGAEGLPQALEYLQMIKVAMHEMIGIPENSLGMAQPISNTSGVALAIQYMPTMMAYDQKRTQYEVGLKRINKLALQTLFLFEPESLIYDPGTEGIREEDSQPVILNPADPEIYNLSVVWPPPLPVDQTIQLSEIQVKQAMGLESKVGALRELGEEFPDEKLAELFDERVVDMEQEAAMQIRRAIVARIIQNYTGLVPEGYAEEEPPPTPNADGQVPPSPPPSPVDNMPLPDLPSIGDITGFGGTNMIENVTTMAFGTKLPQRRNISNTDNS
jgi:hypothetical protein